MEITKNIYQKTIASVRLNVATFITYNGQYVIMLNNRFSFIFWQQIIIADSNYVKHLMRKRRRHTTKCVLTNIDL